MSQLKKGELLGHRIYIPLKSCEIFVPLIKPYILPYFLYKLPQKYKV